MTEPKEGEGMKDELSELGRRLANARRKVEGTCEVCGKPFTGIRTRRYCSMACVQRAYYLRTKSNKSQEGETEL